MGKKRLKKPKRRNPMASALASGFFKKRITRDRTKYTRKKKHKKLSKSITLR